MLDRVPEQILPRFFRRMLEIEDAEKIGRILRETGELPPEANGKVIHSSADGHRTDRRRGLPIVARGVSGTAPGTDPVAELLRQEARDERRR
jgi:hypothetical protein